MFDVGFWELIIIAIVSLLVAGPEKLPGMVRDASKVFNSLRRFITQTKFEIEQELRLDEEKDLAAKIAGMDDLMDIAPDRNSIRKQDTPER